ncbi:MAG: alternative oxidase [Patescibacteria group bacterium]
MVGLIVAIMDMLYGYKNYRRFFVLETIARIPYFSYLSVLHFFQSVGRHPSLALLDLHYKESVNEEYHLMIMEELGGDKFWLDRLVARLIGLTYYWIAVGLFLICPKSGYYLMELIEQSAVQSYTKFIQIQADKLSEMEPGKYAKEYYRSEKARMLMPEKTVEKFSMLDVFQSILQDEAVHVSDMQLCGQLKNLGDYQAR